MSGDLIQNLKIDKWSSPDPQDLLYAKKLLEPFEDTLVERFDGTGCPNFGTSGYTAAPTPSSGGSPRLFVFLAIWLVLFLTFPNVREKSGINQYILWLISAILLFGVVY
jgi:hypothetical protein